MQCDMPKIQDDVAINLFINSVAILNRDALWSNQGKKHYLQAAIVGRIHHTGRIHDRKNIAMNVFLVTMGICQSNFMPSVCTYGVMNF